MSNPNQYGFEWWQARRGHLTSSRMSRVVKGTWRGWKTLMDEMEAELNTDVTPDQWKGMPPPRAIRWGHRWEDLAIDNAVIDYGWMVARPTFVEHPTVPYVGASSDFLVCDPGTFSFVANGEIKCPVVIDRHSCVVMNRQVPTEHLPQIMCQLWVHDLPLSYFLSFHPEMPDPASRLVVLEVPRSDKLIEEMSNKCADFMEIFKRGDRPTAVQVSKKTGFNLTF